MKEYEIKLTTQQREELILIHQNTYERRAADRIKLIILLDQGYTKEEVARILLLDRNTIRTFAKRYLEHGPEALMEDGYSGSEGYLSKAQQQELVKELSNTLYSTAKRIGTYIRHTFGVSYRNDAIVKLLHRLGFSYKKTKGVPAKADVKQQEQFIKKYRYLREKLGKNGKIYFLDAMHPVHNSRPDYGWIRKGSERTIKTVSARNRLNTNGLYSPNDQETVIRSAPAINAQSTLELFRHVRKKHPELNRIIIIHDNARAYHSRWLKARLPKGIDLMPLPAYSPHLNVIERLWKLFRKDVMSNKYYSSFIEFKQASANFFRSLRGRKEQLAALMAENFQSFNTG